MSLTRRLYRLDEVRAAFLYCLKTTQVEQAIFWLNELEESCFSGEARRLLFLSWSLQVGIKRIEWLYQWASNSTTRQGRRLLCIQLMNCKNNDSSIWWLLWAGVLVKTSEDTIINKWKKCSTMDDATFWHFITHTNTYVSNTNIQICCEGLQKEMKSYTWFAKAAAFCITHIPFDSFKETWSKLETTIPSHLLKTNSREDFNIRLERLYAPPIECHYGMTNRGSGSNTIDELNSLGLEHLKSSPYWKQCLADHVNEAWDWASDEDLENFWDTYFGWTYCDHPDEWSAPQKAMSHGTIKNIFDSYKLSNWWNVWVPKERLVVWGSDYKTIKAFQETTMVNTVSSVIDGLLQEYRFVYSNKEKQDPIEDLCQHLQKIWICNGN